MSLIFNVDFRKGSVVNNTETIVPTVTGTPYWSRNCRGQFIYLNRGPYLTYNGIGTIVDNGFTIMMWVKFPTLGPSGQRYEVLANDNDEQLVTLNDSGEIGAFINSATRNQADISSYINQWIALGVRYTGSSMITYVNGSQIATFPAGTIGNIDITNLFIGNYGPNLAIRRADVMLNKVEFWDEDIGVSAIQSDYEEFLASRDSWHTTDGFILPKPVDLSGESNIWSAYNMIIQSGGIVTDISNNNLNLTRSEIVLHSLEGIKLNGTGALIRNAGTTYTNKCVKFRFKTSTAARMGLASGFLDTSMIYISSAGRIGTGDGTLNATSTTGWADGQWHTCIVNRTGTLTYQIFVDGVQQTLVNDGDWRLGTGTYIGQSGLANLPFTGEISDFRVFTENCTLAEAKAYHNSFIKPVLIEEFKNDPADGKSRLPTNWTAGTGTYNVEEKTSADSVLSDFTAGTKVLNCSSAGTIARRSTTAHGTWEFDVYKDADSIILEIDFIGDKKEDTSLNGYGFFIYNNGVIYLSRITNGSGAIILSTATSYIANNTWYRIKITRSKRGVFTVYIKGGSFGETYTLVDVTGGSGSNPVTDNTYKTSNYFVADLDSGDEISRIHITDGVVLE